MNKYESEDKMINPSHYKSNNGIECIDVIKAAVEDKDGFEGYLVGNAIKYLWRFNKKGNPAQDTEKALWYVTYLANYEKEKVLSRIREYEDSMEMVNHFILNNKAVTTDSSINREPKVKTDSEKISLLI